MNKRGFSLVELMVTLIIISLITSALAPVITKKLKSSNMTIGAMGGGGGSGDGSGSGYDPNLTMDCATNFSADCDLCYTNACISCNKKCSEGTFKNVSACKCLNCKEQYSEFCADCDTNACTRCIDGHGLTSGGSCTELACPDGQYTDNGMSLCTTCPAGSYCRGGIKTLCEKDEYSIVGASECQKCTDAIANCAKCMDASSCQECIPGYTPKNGVCELAMDSVNFTTAGTHYFKVPSDVKQIKATLVSGGAGGGAGANINTTVTFVTNGAGNKPTDAGNHTVLTSATGLFNWTIPEYIKGKDVLLSACGGGGGGGTGGGGGKGGAIKNSVFPMPDWTTIKIAIGGGGGGVAHYNSASAAAGGCAYGGAGTMTGSKSYVPASCQAPSGYGAGAAAQSARSGAAGYDPVYAQHGSGGGGRACGHSYCGGNGSKVGGGGGGGGLSTKHGGGGGGATLFLHQQYAETAKWVAPGGGGGGSRSTSSESGAGGGGGGVGGGAGGGLASGGGAGRGYNVSIFGSGYCNGGGASGKGQDGAMRLAYVDALNGATGGGAGHMVINQTVAVIPGETLTVIVGRGGAGGKAGYTDSSGNFVTSTAGEGASEAMVSKIINSKGAVLLTSAINPTIMGATGGNPNGSTAGTAGFITNGLNTTQISATAGYVNNPGNIANAKKGGAGGQTYLGDNTMIHCVGLDGGTEGQKGPDSPTTSYGGCGGAGGGAGADGGSGAQGFVKIDVIKPTS